MIPRSVRTYWWLILILVPLTASVSLGASSSRLVQRAAALLIVYGVAVAIIWLRVAFQSRRSFVVHHVPFVIREK
jgi:hypothetical protein